MRRSTSVVLGTALAAAALVFAGGRSSADEISQRAQRLLKRAIVLDTHDDTPQRMIYENFDLAARDTRGHIDIPRMREGGLNGIFFSIWTPGTVPQLESVQVALRQIDAVREQARRHPNDLMLATSAAEIRAAHSQGKIAALMGVEGGHMIAEDLAILRIYAALGVRYMTLTHSVNDDWADSSTDKPAHNGLTSFGKDVVREMNRLGMMVDISHVSDKTFYDVLEITRAPVIASHSSCRAICNAPRNMTDEMIRALARNGGVIQINYHIGFLSQEYADASKANKEVSKPLEDQLAVECGKNQACRIRGEGRINQKLTAAGKLPPVSWEKIIEHIDHVVKLVGPDYVGLGSDFDGAVMPQGMEDVSHLPRITEALLRRGYSEADIEKILGGNLLRVMQQVEKVSREAQTTK